MKRIPATELEDLVDMVSTGDKLMPAGLPEWVQATISVDMKGGRSLVTKCTRFYRNTAQDGAAYEAAVKLGIIQVSGLVLLPIVVPSPPNGIGS